MKQFTYNLVFVVVAMFVFVVVAMFIVSDILAQEEETVAVTNLRCEYRTNPLGIDEVKPRLSWILGSDVRGQKQTAYQVLVAASMDKLTKDNGDLWDSGKVCSDQTIHVVYEGRPLKSRMQCFWKVMVWDKDGKASSWSKPAMWSVGFLKASGGKARRIADAGVGADRSPHSGYHSKFAKSADSTKWVAVDLGKSKQINAVRLFPARPYDWRDTPGFLFPVRFKIEIARKQDFSDAKTVVDRTDKDVTNPGAAATIYRFTEVPARYVRLTVTKLRLRDGNNFALALAEMQVLADQKNVAEGTGVTALDSIESGSWSKTRLVDGRVTSDPGGGSAPAGWLRKSFTVSKPADWKPVPYKAIAPTGGVRLNGGLFQTALENNIAYLLDSFSVNDMLRPFRLRAGQKNPPIDRPVVRFWCTDLFGSNAGRFLMGAGNTLRWLEHEKLRQKMNALIDGIEQCAGPDGYILAYTPDRILHNEQGNYARSWFTQGMIEASIAGHPKALKMMRATHDWFNKCKYLPKMLSLSLGIQGHIASTRMYFTPLGKPEDILVAEKYYVLDWWMEQLANQEARAIWKFPLNRPHCYEITAFEAYLDHYRAQGDTKYLNAMLGAWQLLHDNWEHVGGSWALCEGGSFPPHSYYLTPKGRSGETCCSVFWIKFNQRFHQLYPEQEKYVSEIEKSIYNICLANQDGAHGIRYHTRMEQRKVKGTRRNSCCEGQGTRFFGSLPEYIYSIADDGIYVNLYEPSTINYQQDGQSVTLKMLTDFPFRPEVSIRLSMPQPLKSKIHLRIPSWAAKTMPIKVNGKRAAVGKPGTYQSIERTWSKGDEISFTLPMDFRLTAYTGLDQIKGHRRYALEYGPVLMAVVGPLDKKLGIRISQSPDNPKSWLKPILAKPLHFSIEGHPKYEYMPYWQIAHETFTTYPIIEPLKLSGWKAQWIADPTPALDQSPHNGYHSKFAKSADTTKWVAVNLGKSKQINAVRLFPARPYNWRPDTPGFLFPVRFKIEIARKPDFSDAKTVVNRTDKDVANPGTDAPIYRFTQVSARYVRLTVTKLRLRDGNSFGLALAEMQVLAGQKNVAEGTGVTALDSIESGSWSKTRLVDGRAESTAGGRVQAHGSNVSALMLRKEIDLPKKPVRGTAYICGLGYYELFINGKKVGDHILDPGFTDYTKRVLYVTYDITSLLQSGRSAIGVVLGNGWYNNSTRDAWGFQTAPWIAQPELLLRVDVEYSDGSSKTIVSDETWKISTDGPIVYNSIRGGETYDARREMPGWDRPGYDDSAWANARVAAAPKGRLQAQYHPPIRVVKTIRPAAITEPKKGVYVFDMGVNMAGWTRLKTRGRVGQKITLVFNELLNRDGTVNTRHLAGLTKGRFQTCEFILKGEGEEVFEPRFTYNGFRYVQVTGLSEKPTKDTLVGREVHTDPAPAGEFSCSNPLINRIHKMILQTQLSNIHGIPTDCPHREKIGWTGDGYITMDEAIHNFRMPMFYLKWLRDMFDAQDDNGHASCIAPSPGWGKSKRDGSPHFLSDPWWGGAIVRLPWKHYCYYGDRRILEEAYEPMKKYLAYVATQSPGYISWSNEGDWLEVGRGGSSKRTPPRLAGTAAYFYHAKTVAKIAKLLGKNEDAVKYSKLAENISGAFHKKYFDAVNGLYCKDSQTAPAMALYFGMTPLDKRTLVLDNLLKNIRETRRNHISSGIIGTYYVFQELMESGHDDAAYAMVTQQDSPSWGYMLSKGATTVWEAWNGGNASRNHPALGSIDSWFYEGLGGIRLDPATVAFKQIIIKPAVVGDLKWVKCSHQSLRGKIVSNWKLNGEKLHMEITIPANTTATVYVPAKHAADVTESGRTAKKAEGVKFLRMQDGAAVYKVDSGSYRFYSKGYRG